MSAPDKSDRSNTIYVKIAGGAALAAFVIVMIPPLMRNDGETPGAVTLALVAIGVSAVTGVVLVSVLRGDLGLPWAIVGLSVGYNLAIVLVKFFLGPLSIYQRPDIPETFIGLGQPVGILIATGIVLALYLLVFALIRRLVQQRHGLLVPRRPDLPGSGTTAAGLVFTVLAAVIVVGVGGVIALIVLSPGLEYLSYLVTSPFAIATAGFVVIAAVLCFGACDTVAARTRALGDATLLTTFLTVALVFIVVFHVLWVVLMLVLTSIWPLRTVTPK